MGLISPTQLLPLRTFHSRHMPDPDAEGEARFAALGMAGLGRILLVVYAYGDKTIRIISARRASRNERAQYEKYI
jgi:uncharacterized DUF497 family protein